MSDAFQSTINIEMGFGIVGELFDNSPRRCDPYALNSGDATQNVIGRAFTVLTADPADGSASATAEAGGTGVFAGLLVNPKAYASFGTSTDPLAPTLTLPNWTIVELCVMGDVIVQVPGACNIGDQLFYDTTTGVLGTISPQFSGTGSITTTTLTISAQDAGNTGLLGVGSRVTGPNIAPGTYITAVGQAGNIGTFTINNSQTAASAAVKADTTVAAGKALVPHSEIVRYAPTGANVAVVRLTN